MKKWIFALILSSAIASVAANDQSKHLCEGFIPENDMQIPVGQKSAGGITEADFNAVLDRIEKQYTDEVASLGGTLKVNRLWENATVNASAQQVGKDYIINMYGGLARHKTITIDGFALVACHEMGHHLGGAPKSGSIFGRWASNEGQADYYSTLKCLRRYFASDDNEAILAGMQLDQYAVDTCGELNANQLDRLLCIRGAHAGLSVAFLFQDLRGEKTPAQFNTPDANKVVRTDDRHPGSQCRLDTYFAGATCIVPVSSELSNDDYHLGTCADSATYKFGLRSRCWFKPLEDDAPVPPTEPVPPTTKPAPVPAPAFTDAGSIFW